MAGGSGLLPPGMLTVCIGVYCRAQRTCAACPRRYTPARCRLPLCGPCITLYVKHELHRDSHGVWHACPAPTPALPSIYVALSSANTDLRIRFRKRKPFEKLSRSQRHDRVKEARWVCEEVLKIPVSELHRPTVPVPEVIHLPTAARVQIRGVPSLHIPSEDAIIAWKQQLATTHATETGTFAGGAFITDPVRFVSVLCAQSPFIAVGGDRGGGHTELQDCRAEGFTPFVGDSAAFPHVWAVLQHLIDTRGAFLNGDWCFLNAVLGLMSPSATHPRPICIVGKSNLLGTSRYRTSADKHSLHPQQPALLTISPERIVPTPLHLFLGISNRIILDAFSELLGKERVEAALQAVTTVHSAGCSGAGDLHDLNGPEISKWIKQECSARVLAAAAVTTSPAALSAATTASHSILTRWLQQLHTHLLHKREWTATEIFVWRSVVSDIHQHWRAETSINAFPKLHMLHHSVDFAERHRFLGRASEAQIESFHASFNALFHKQHRNQSSDTAERLRRSLADATLRAVQPLLIPSPSHRS